MPDNPSDSLFGCHLSLHRGGLGAPAPVRQIQVFKQLSKTDKHIEYYKNKFHIIVPIMSGHNPDVKDDFISFAADAIEIEDYILSRYGKEIYAVYRMSMGGVLTATLWQNNRLRYVKKHHPNTTVKCFKGKFHCENALFNPEIMIVELDKIFDK